MPSTALNAFKYSEILDDMPMEMPLPDWSDCFVASWPNKRDNFGDFSDCPFFCPFFCPQRWGHLGTFGDIWGQMGTFGDIWGHLGTFGDKWGQMGTNGDKWGQMGTFGDIWGHLGTFGDNLHFGDIVPLLAQ
jgi:hypothetical protein